MDPVILRKPKHLIYLLKHQCLQETSENSMVGLLNLEDISSIVLNAFLSTNPNFPFNLHFSCLMPVHRFSSQNPPDTFVFILLSVALITAEQHDAFFKIRQTSFLSDENIIWDGKAASLLSCALKCARQTTCKSASFMTSEGRCSLHDGKQTKLSGTPLQREHSFYLKKVCSTVLFCFT